MKRSESVKENTKIIYLHGFKGSAKSGKAQMLKDWFGATNVITPEIDYKQETIFKSFMHLRDLITAQLSINQQILVVGSSFGGFMAFHLFKIIECRTLLINPAITSEKLIELTGIDTSEIESFTNNSDFIRSDLNIWLAKDDERLGLDFVNEIKLRFQYARIDEFDDAGHRFSSFSACKEKITRLLLQGQN